MLLLPHHPSAAQRRPTNKPLCKQMSHDMFVCCAESSRQVLQSFVLILLWFYQTLIISLGNMWPQLGLHLRHQRSHLFCVVASIWGIWLHWTLFFYKLQKDIADSLSVYERRTETGSPPHAVVSILLPPYEWLGQTWHILMFRTEKSTCQLPWPPYEEPLWYLHRYVRAPNTVCHCHICKRASRYETAYGILIVLFKKYFFIPLSCIAQNRLQLLYSVKQKTINYSQLHLKPT